MTIRGRKIYSTLTPKQVAYILRDSGARVAFVSTPAMALKVPLPERPPVVGALGQQESSVTLNWEAVTDANGNPVLGYNLYRSTTSGGPYTKVNTELITETTYTDTGTDTAELIIGTSYVVTALANGTTYYYVVKAVDSEGRKSAGSNTAGEFDRSLEEAAKGKVGGGLAK